ncbi:MAG TPA: GNAT family N-acetyltransferase [Blastocatellia bacterium]|nr:GNAT family N-acetyltransferase [Blastocatellia bacterium]
MSAIIRTVRLSLQPLSLDDLDLIHALWTNPGVRRFLFDDQIISREQAASEINESIERFETLGCGLWRARLRQQPELIGFCGYRFFHDPPQLQLLYGFHPDYWSKGFATEAARAMIRFGFERAGLDFVIASADAPNLASLAVMERAGMSFDRRETVNEMDTVYYRLDRRDFSPDTTFYEVSHSDIGNNSREAS